MSRIIEKLRQEHKGTITFSQISLRSRSLLRKAVREQDAEAIESLILDIEHSIQTLTGSLFEIINGAGKDAGTFGEYYNMAVNTLAWAELEYEKITKTAQ